MRLWHILAVVVAAVFIAGFTLNNFQLTVSPPTPPPGGPTLAINGSTAAGQTVPGSTMIVTASGGPGDARDFLMVCITGGACDGGTYASSYLNCSQSPPAAPYPTGTPPSGCTFAVPTTASNQYYLKWQNLDLPTGAIATLAFSVGGGGGGTPAITAVQVNPNIFSVPQGGTAPFSGTLLAVCTPSPCPGTASFLLSSGSGGGTGCTGGSCIAVNGSTTGITVAPGASLSLQVTGGETDVTTDWMSFCTNLGGPPTVSAASCADTASSPGPYPWAFVASCTTHAPPNAPYFDGNTNGAGTCTLTAPAAPGTYLAAFFNNDGYNGAGCGGNGAAQTACVATAPFTVSSGGGGGPAVVQNLYFPKASQSVSNNVISAPISQAVRSGDIVVGYSHHATGSDTSSDPQIPPVRIYDNAGNTYTQTASMFWAPYGSEMITGWYKANVQGNPTTFYFDFTNYSGTMTTGIDAGFVEYSGATAVDFVGPVRQYQLNPTITVTPSASPSLMWAFSATDTEDSNPCQDGGNGNMISPGGYQVLIDRCANSGIGVLGSPGTVGAGSVTFTWMDTYYNASNCSDGSVGPCSTVMMGAAVH